MEKDKNVDPLSATCFDDFVLVGYFSTKRVDLSSNESNNGRLVFYKNSKQLIIDVSSKERNFWNKYYIKFAYCKTIQGYFLKLKNLSRATWAIYSKTHVDHYEFDVGTCCISKVPINNDLYTDMNFKLTNFDSWIPILGEKEIKPFNKKDKTGVKLSIQLPSKKFLGVVTYKNKAMKFYINTSLLTESAYHFSINRKNLVRSETYLNVKYLKPDECKDMLSLVQQFERLFSLIIGKHQMIKYICCFKGGKSINLLPRQLYGTSHVKDISEYKEYIFSLESMKFEFIKILNNFLNPNIGLKLLIDNYLMTYSKDFYVPNVLTDLCQGIDSFYEGKKNSPYALEKRIKEMINSLPICLTVVLRENRSVLLNSLFSKIKHGDISDKDFKDKNGNIVLNLKDTISIWARIIKDTRIYFVHGNSEKTKFRLDNLIEESKNVRILQFLVKCFILQELGYKSFNRSQITDRLEELLKAKYFPIK